MTPKNLGFFFNKHSVTAIFLITIYEGAFIKGGGGGVKEVFLNKGERLLERALIGRFLEDLR